MIPPPEILGILPSFTPKKNNAFTCFRRVLSNLDLEDALAHLVKRLEEEGIADDTVIVLSTDHFPYGLDSDAALGNMPYLSELYGYNVDDYFKRDHNRLILWSGCLEDMEPIIVDTPTYSLEALRRPD